MKVFGLSLRTVVSIGMAANFFVLFGLAETASAQVTGKGTVNYVPKWTGNTSLGKSKIFQNSQGKIGIGTTNPVAQLHVSDNLFVGDSNGPFSPQDSTVYFGHSRKFISETSGVDIAGSNDWLTFAQHTGAKGFAWGTSTSDATPHDAFTPLMVLQTEAGRRNVGIGTTGPEFPLDIRGSAANANVNLLGLINSAPGGGTSMEFGGNGVSAAAIRYRYDSTYGQTLGLYAGDLNTSKMMILGSGNVGIGTASPSHLLSVNGPVRAKEIIVDTGWADYVFDEDHKLTPLAELEKQIKERKHLPDIPSGQEVRENGVNVGEMQTKLLAKVEELTLYLIEQNKKLTQLEQENVRLKGRIASLESK